MIVADGFVFLHLHKSGGTFANEALLKHAAGARAVGYHLPARLIPPAARHLPVLGLVRNPFGYYVSWYSYQQQRPRPNALFRVLSDEGRLDFAVTLHRMLDLGRDDALLDRVLAALPRDYGAQGLNLPGFALAPIRGTGLGFYAWLYGYLYDGATGPLHVGRMEDLPRSLLDLLDAAGVPATPALRAHLAGSPPRNRSTHADHRHYYDAALRARVEAQDGALLARHGYRFEA